VDLLGTTVMSASSSASIKYQKIVAETSKVSEFAYPQLLGRQILLHPPRFFAAIFSVIKQARASQQQCCAANAQRHHHSLPC
jgi:hypothetical protein